MNKSPLQKRLEAVFLGAIAFVIMLLIGLPILPSASFLKYEPSGAILLFSGIFLGAAGGVISCVIKAFLFFIVGAGNIFGVVSDLLANLAFILPACLVIQKVSGMRGRLIGYIVGTVIGALVMIPVNLVILQLEFGMDVPTILGMMLPAILPFNLLKGVCNSVVYELLGRPLSRVLQKHPQQVPES